MIWKCQKDLISSAFNVTVNTDFNYLKSTVSFLKMSFFFLIFFSPPFTYLLEMQFQNNIPPVFRILILNHQLKFNYGQSIDVCYSASIVP